MQGNIEQRYAIKFCVKLTKTKQEAYEMLKEVNKDQRMRQASFYRWLNIFLTEMKTLIMNHDLEPRKLLAHRKTLRK